MKPVWFEMGLFYHLFCKNMQNKFPGGTFANEPLRRNFHFYVHLSSFCIKDQLASALSLVI
jgi:hypothetical protein